MSTNYAPLLADLFLYSYEAEFIQGLLKKNKKKLSRSFNSAIINIKDALKKKPNSYNIWLKNGKPNDRTNHLLLQKKKNKKEFHRAVRIEVARQKEIEKVNIMEARSNNMELFHKLIQKNRKKRS
jgi:hypothetical protein